MTQRITTPTSGRIGYRGQRMTHSHDSGADPPGRSTLEPLQLVIELARAQDAGDPYAFRFSEQTYVIREEGGGYESAVFNWDNDVLEEMERIQRPRPDRE